MTIRTNNVPRNTMYGYELTEKERKEFDYIPEDDLDFHDFARYKGRVYDLSEFIRIPDSAEPEMKAWDGYTSETFFSGSLVKYTNDTEQVIMGEYYS